MLFQFLVWKIHESRSQDLSFSLRINVRFNIPTGMVMCVGQRVPESVRLEQNDHMTLVAIAGRFRSSGLFFRCLRHTWAIAGSGQNANYVLL